MKTTKLTLSTKDIKVITGKSDRWCRREKAEIKVRLNKEAHQELTIPEYCQFKGLKEDEAREVIGNFEANIT